MSNSNYIQEFKAIFCKNLEDYIVVSEKVISSFGSNINMYNSDAHADANADADNKSINLEFFNIETNLGTIEKARLPRVILNTISKSFIRYLNVSYDKLKETIIILFEVYITKIDKYYSIEFQLTYDNLMIKIKFNEIKLEECKEPWYYESYKLGYKVFEKDESYNSKEIIESINWITNNFMITKHIPNINLPLFYKLNGDLKEYSTINYSDCCSHVVYVNINIDIPLKEFLAGVIFMNKLKVLQLKTKELRECIEYIIDISGKLYYFDYYYTEHIVNNFDTLISVCKSKTYITLLRITDDFSNSLRSLGVYAKATKSYEFLRDKKYNKLLYLDIN
jgi:hypothetical protein